MTNYEKIKAMSVEEMADFIRNTTKSLAINLNGTYIVNDERFIKLYLESEVEEDG